MSEISIMRIQRKEEYMKEKRSKCKDSSRSTAVN